MITFDLDNLAASQIESMIALIKSGALDDSPEAQALAVSELAYQIEQAQAAK